VRPGEKDAFEFAYSGDCRPCKRFAKAHENTTVLVHEATFDDELRPDAIAKRHSTTSEALGVGALMKARRVLLTHFSQRYQKIPVFETNGNGGKSEAVELAAEASDVEMQDDVPDSVDFGEEVPAAPLEAEPPLQPSRSRSASPRPLPGAALVLKPPPWKMKVGVAFDLMRVKVGEIAGLERLVPALQQLFRDEAKGEPEEDPEVLKKATEQRARALERTRKAEMHEGKGGGKKWDEKGKKKGKHEVQRRLSIGEREKRDSDGSDQFVGEGKAPRLVSEAGAGAGG
jgi:ribonuclease Z